MRMLDLTPVLRAYARLRMARLARLDPVESQRHQLLKLVRRAANTRFGRAHDFARVRSVVDFQARVPLRRYEEFWRDWWAPRFPVVANETWPGPAPFFALSSGTTSGRTKYIPVTPAMRRSNEKAATDTLLFHLASRPRSRLMSGKTLMLGGSTALAREADGVYSGDLSAIAAKTASRWTRPYTLPDPETMLIDDWEEKLDRMARAAVAARVTGLTGTPSWVLILLERIAALRKGAPLPDLDLYVHGGISFAPYRKRFRELLGDGPDMREVYAASEGFVASADRDYGEGLRLNLGHGIFFEFVPVDELDAPNPIRHWIADAEIGVNYAIVLSTCAGAWSYVVGDTVRLVTRDPPRVLVTGRTSYGLSAFGEHLIAEEIETAVAAAAEAIGATIPDYSVAAEIPAQAGALGRHVFVVEFAPAMADGDALVRFAAHLDRELVRLNADYAAHRRDDTGLDAPTVMPVPPGAFAAWMKSRGKQGGQNKVPRIVHDPELWASLLRFAKPAHI